MQCGSINKGVVHGLAPNSLSAGPAAVHAMHKLHPMCTLLAAHSKEAYTYACCVRCCAASTALGLPVLLHCTCSSLLLLLLTTPHVSAAYALQRRTQGQAHSDRHGAQGGDL
jgi:hypothetical protein